MDDREARAEGAAGRAFVVQFLQGDGDPQRDFRGRVERVASGESRHFQSIDELVAFLVRSLGRNLTNEEGRDGGPANAAVVKTEGGDELEARSPIGEER